MQKTISTRRSNKGKIICQQIPNLFNSQNYSFFQSLPQQIVHILPTLQKISCQNITRIHNIPYKKSHEEMLKIIQMNSKNQQKLIYDIIDVSKQYLKETKEEDSQLDGSLQVQEDDIKQFEAPLRKIHKKEECTRSILDFSQQNQINQKMFLDEKLLSKIDNYLSIN